MKGLLLLRDDTLLERWYSTIDIDLSLPIGSGSEPSWKGNMSELR